MAMKIIDVMMPVKDGNPIPYIVLKALMNQEREIRLYVRTNTLKSKMESIVDNRNALKKYATSEYILWLDSDVVLPRNGLIDMERFLDEHREYAAVALSYCGPPEEEEHITMGCMLVRKQILDLLTFRFDQRCECSYFCQDIHELGYRVRYLTNLTAKHIDPAGGHQRESGRRRTLLPSGKWDSDIT